MKNNQNIAVVGLGIDQGIANCGYSVIRSVSDMPPVVLTSGVIQTSSKLILPERLALIYLGLNALVSEFKPHIIGCEKLFFNPQLKDPNNKQRNKSASIVMTNMATGIVNFIAGKKQILLQDFVPGTVKKYVTGYGRASKEEVIAAVHNVLMKGKVGEHEADATAIAITAVKYFQDMDEHE